MALTSVPQFDKNQTVRFVGGEGRVRGYHSDAGTWAYTVEMPMGPEPTMGRIGYETTIMLLEPDLEAA